MLKGNLYFTYFYIPQIDPHYLFLDFLLDGTRKSRAIKVCGESCGKNFHWRIPLVCGSRLASLPEKAAETSTGTFAKQGINVVLSLWRGIMTGKYFYRASAVGIIDFCSLSLSVHCVYQFSCRCLIIAMVQTSTQGSSRQKLIKNYFCVMKWVLREKDENEG